MTQEQAAKRMRVRALPTSTQDRVIKAINAGSSQGLLARELETSLGLFTEDVKTATKWLSRKGYIKGRSVIMKVDCGRKPGFNHQHFARRRLIRWVLTDMGRNYAAEVVMRDATPVL